MNSHRCAMAVRAGTKITYGYLGTWSPDEGKAWALNCMIVDWNSENPIQEKKIRILYCPYCGKKLKKPKREKDGGGDEQA